MAGKTKWMNYKPATRDRIAREAEKIGISRRSAREMTNRGTWNPLARDADKREQAYKRLPDDVIRHPEKYPQLESRERDIDALRERMTDRLFQLHDVDDPFSETSRGSVVKAMGEATPVALVAMDRMSDAELKKLGATFQVKNGTFIQVGKLPHGLSKADVTWSENGHTYSIWWYHSGGEANDYI